MELGITTLWPIASRPVQVRHPGGQSCPARMNWMFPLNRRFQLRATELCWKRLPTMTLVELACTLLQGRRLVAK